MGNALYGRDVTPASKAKEGAAKRGITARGIAFLIIAVVCIVVAIVLISRLLAGPEPPGVLRKYVELISDKDYATLVDYVDLGQTSLDEEGFARRNSAIYDGIEAHDFELEVDSYDPVAMAVHYRLSFQTIAGPVSVESLARFAKTSVGYRIKWDDSMIFPSLTADGRVTVLDTPGSRGRILDREGNELAGPGIASSVGIVPGELEDRELAVKSLAGLLDIGAGEIKDALSASWVTDDVFVPIATVPKIYPTGKHMQFGDADLLKEAENQNRMRSIPGVKIVDIDSRSYPLGKAAAHLTGYVQQVNAEDIAEHPDGDYRAGDVIGKAGIEALYEDKLRAHSGIKIVVLDGEGRTVDTIAETPPRNGEDVRLAIDSRLQSALYEQFSSEQGCSVAMNPITGEVLALVSTPAYDPNDFATGIRGKKWSALNDDPARPLYNRFRQVWPPGSSFKPIVAAIGVELGAIDPYEDFGYEGLSWKKDQSWGDYEVTTLRACSPATLENAIVYSDNIYFAKAALKIGANQMCLSLNRLGFANQLPFEIVMSASQYANNGFIENEIQLADSGYGQGQVLVNPLHLACLYTAFLNGGNVLRPALLFEEGSGQKIWIEGAFSPYSVDVVKAALVRAVTDPEGTGYVAFRDDVSLAGKTGTAETKASRDEGATEYGWFAVMTADADAAKPVLVVSMVEGVEGIGGSTYVVSGVSSALESWL